MAAHIALLNAMTTSTAALWAGNYVILAASLIAAGGVLFGVARWLANRFFSHEISYASSTLSPSVRNPSAVVPIGKDAVVIVRVLVRRPVEFNDIQVRPQELTSHLRFGGWRFWKRGGLRLWREYEKAPLDAVRVVSIGDAEAELIEQSNGRVALRRVFVTFPVVDAPGEAPRGGIIGRFDPPFPRLAEEAIFIRVTLRARREWSGYLSLYLPSATQRRYWVRLPLRSEADS